MNNFVTSQKEVNAVLADHVHATGAGPTTANPLVQAVNEIANVSNMQDQTQLLFEKTTNIVAIINNYLSPTGNKYINSRYNTTT